MTSSRTGHASTKAGPETEMLPTEGECKPKTSPKVAQTRADVSLLGLQERRCEGATTHSRRERKVGTLPQGKRVQQKGKRKPEALPRKCEHEVDALPQGSSNKVKCSPAWSGLRYIWMV